MLPLEILLWVFGLSELELRREFKARRKADELYALSVRLCSTREYTKVSSETMVRQIKYALGLLPKKRSIDDPAVLLLIQLVVLWVRNGIRDDENRAVVFEVLKEIGENPNVPATAKVVASEYARRHLGALAATIRIEQGNASPVLLPGELTLFSYLPTAMGVGVNRDSIRAQFEILLEHESSGASTRSDHLLWMFWFPLWGRDAKLGLDFLLDIANQTTLPLIVRAFAFDAAVVRSDDFPGPYGVQDSPVGDMSQIVEVIIARERLVHPAPG